MLHHISLPVSDLAKSTTLYSAVFAELGYRVVCQAKGFVGYGVEDGKDKFALIKVSDAKAAGKGFHLAFDAPSRRAVDGFYNAAIKHGASDNGAPGLRPHYSADYYAAFVIDPDGHRLEVVCNPPA